MIVIYILNFITVLFNSIYIEKYLHIYQLRDYNFNRYLRYFLKIRGIYHVFCVISLIFSVIFKNLIFLSIVDIVFLIVSIIYHRRLIGSKKTPLKHTPKIKRLYVISILLLLLTIPLHFGAMLSHVILLLLPMLSNLLNIYDKIKNKNYIKSAQLKLRLNKAKIIAITGSNGKTSVKNILYEFLRTKYKVLMTPKSFNTPLGISKFINESLIADFDYVILEYGARKIHDISKLCKLFGADYGIITLVAPQHLSTFKNIENIYNAKSELSKYLCHDICVFNLDNIYTYRMYQERTNKKLGISIFSKSDIYASEIKIVDYNTEFFMHFKDSKIKFRTRMLGRHNVTNILLASALAIHLGVDMSDIKKACETLPFVPHRLELIKTDINILDDSYNCSLLSAEESISVLSSLPNKKMIVTPGIIEAGKYEYEINYKLGRLCHASDIVVIIGRQNKDAIRDGLLSTGFHTQNLFYADTLALASKYYSILNKGDNLLLLNDLPDDYQ